MRLLRCVDLQLHEFYDDEIPPYAILSHTWDRGQEVSYQDLQLLNKSKAGRSIPDVDLFDIASRSGYDKIVQCAKLAQSQGLEWVWIDTCCIDKTSSAELSEAINSMYRWYKESHVCYAYLSDVLGPREESKPLKERLRSSRWFTRGWTLQELLAPDTLQFYNRHWLYVGNRSTKKRRRSEIPESQPDTHRQKLVAPKFPVDLSSEISFITSINRSILSDGVVERASVAQRMSWASRRQTSRREDKAYCLLGLFNINMPLLYGEGDRAFVRLQEEIIKVSDDHSIFAWHNDIIESPTACYSGFLAPNLGAFVHCGSIVRAEDQRARRPYSVMNTGLRIELPLYHFSQSDRILCLLNCRDKESQSSALAIHITEAWTFNHEYFLKNKKRSGILPRTSELRELHRDNSVVSPVSFFTSVSDEVWQRETSVLTIGAPFYNPAAYEVASDIIYLRRLPKHTYCNSAFGGARAAQSSVWPRHAAHKLGAFLLHSSRILRLVILRHTREVEAPLAPCIIAFDVVPGTSVTRYCLREDVVLSTLYFCLKEGKPSAPSTYVRCVTAKRAFGEILVADFENEIVNEWHDSGDIPSVEVEKVTEWRGRPQGSDPEPLPQADLTSPINLCLRVSFHEIEQINALFDDG